MRNRPAFAVLFVLAVTGCASHSANERPEPNVVKLTSVPPHASVTLDCGGGTVAHGTTPLRVDMPRYPAVCTMVVAADGYRRMDMHFDRGLVLREGKALRQDGHHALDQRAGTIDMLFFPLRNLGDRVQNATAHVLYADYQFELKLKPE